MSSKSILILTQEIDFQADSVIEELNRRSIEIFRFDTSYFPMKSILKASNNSSGWEGTISFYDKIVPIDKIVSIWYRRPSAFNFNPNMTPEERSFAQAEALMAVGGLIRSIDCLWVNHPEKIVSADYKPFQQKLASTIGFNVPRTLITNSPDAVKQFYDECGGNIIYKTFSSPSYAHPDLTATQIFTSRVEQKDLDHLEQVKNTACMFQEYVPKKLELRVTIIGNKIFAAEIYSQNSIESSVDWRRSYKDLSYGIHKLPETIKVKCLELMQNLSLVFAAIDMIVTPKGEYFFLELNANGQWGWIEDETGMPMSEAMADLLMDGV